MLSKLVNQLDDNADVVSRRFLMVELQQGGTTDTGGAYRSTKNIPLRVIGCQPETKLALAFRIFVSCIQHRP